MAHRVAFMARRLHIVVPATSRTLCGREVGREVEPLVYQANGGAIAKLPRCEHCWATRR